MLVSPSPVGEVAARASDAILSALPAASSAGPHGDDTPRLDGWSVLIVDDNDVNQQVAGELLRSAGAETCTAANGLDAVEFLRRRRVDCVLMDIHMPVMDGLQATRIIRAQRGLTRLPVLALTADAGHANGRRCQAAGMNDFLTKPVTRHALCSGVAKWVTGAGESLGPASWPAPPAADIEAPAAAGSPFAGDPEIIDLSVLAGVLGGNQENIKKFAYMFAEMMGRTLVEMSEALAREDLPALRALGHRARSSAATVGAMRLASMCAALQASPSLAGEAGARALVLGMPPLLARIKAVIDGAFQR